MPEPTTPNTALIVPNTGDLVGTWGSQALNPNFVAIDGMFGGSTLLSIGAPTTITLTAPTAGTIAPTAGPNQSQNALIKLQGTASGITIIKLTMPGRYIFHNQVTNNPFIYTVQVSSVSGLGNKVGLPLGKKTTVFFDGTDCDYVDMPDPGTSYDLHTGGGGSLPAWMNACTVPPYLIKNGAIYTYAQFPALAHMLSNQFGGNGVSTFAVPDELARARIAYDPVGTGRMTSPVDATTMGSVGGEQAHLLLNTEMAFHTHGINDPGHSHPGSTVGGVNASGVSPGSFATAQNPSSGGSIPLTIATAFTGIGDTNPQNNGGNAHNNVQPSIVSFLPLIKT